MATVHSSCPIHGRCPELSASESRSGRKNNGRKQSPNIIIVPVKKNTVYLTNTSKLEVCRFHWQWGRSKNTSVTSFKKHTFALCWFQSATSAQNKICNFKPDNIDIHLSQQRLDHPPPKKSCSYLQFGLHHLHKNTWPPKLRRTIEKQCQMTRRKRTQLKEKLRFSVLLAPVLTAV